jgi:hypothetical protein
MPDSARSEQRFIEWTTVSFQMRKTDFRIFKTGAIHFYNKS